MKNLFKVLVLSVFITALCILGLTACNNEEKPEIEDNRTVIISQTDLDLVQGNVYTLTAKLSVGDGEFVWTSSDEKIAKVSGDGVVTCVGTGSVVITAKCGDKSASCNIDVALPDFMPVFTDSSQVLTIVKEQKFDIDTELTFDGKRIDAALSFESENPEIASVDANGKVTGVSFGETYINVTADYCGLIATMRVKIIVNANVAIESSRTEVTLSTVTIPQSTNISTEILSLSVFKNDEDISEDLELSWRVENEDILNLFGNGSSVEIKAKGVGKTKVIASFTFDAQEFNYAFNVTVKKAEITLTPSNGILRLDLTAIDGDISELSVDGVNVHSSLTAEKILSLIKTSVSAGEKELVITTAEQSYSVILNIDKEEIVLDDAKVTASDGAYSIDLSAAGIDWESIMELTVNGTDASAYRSGDIIALPEASTPYGYYLVSVVTKGRTDYKLDAFCYTTKLNTQTVKSPNDLILFLSGAPNASFVLEEDISFGGRAFGDYVINFGGTLDGQGHAIKNFSIVPTTLKNQISGSDLNAVYLIQNNSGTIKNIIFDYEMREIADCNLSSLIGKNTGTVENCYVKMHFTSVRKSWNFAPLVNDNYGSVKNCIVVITKNTAAATHPEAGKADDDNESLGKHFGSVVSIARQDSVITNCYAVYNDVLTGYDAKNPCQYNGFVNGATVKDCQNFKTVEDLIASVTAFPTENGWGEYWSVNDGNIYFGKTPLSTAVNELFGITGFRYGRTIFANKVTPRLDLEFFVNMVLADTENTGEAVYAVAKNATVYVNGQAYQVTINYNPATRAISFSVENPAGWTPIEGSDNFASDPEQKFVVKISAGQNIGSYTLEADAIYLITKPEGLDASTAHPRATCTGEVYDGSTDGSEFIPEEPQKTVVNITSLRGGTRVIFVNKTTPRFDLEFFIDSALLDSEGNALESGASIGTVTVIINGTSYTVNATYNIERENVYYIAFSVENPAGWTPIEGSDNFASDPEQKFVVKISAGQNIGSYTLEADAIYLITKPEGLDASTAHPRATCTGEVYDGSTDGSEFIGGETGGGGNGEGGETEKVYINLTSIRWARAIYVNKNTPQLDLNLFLDKNLDGVEANTELGSIKVILNGKEYTVTMLYLTEAGTNKGYIQFSVQNPLGWTPIEGSDNFASDPEQKFVVKISAGQNIGNYTLEADAIYLITKPEGLDASTAHPRATCTGEVYDGSTDGSEFV